MTYSLRLTPLALLAAVLTACSGGNATPGPTSAAGLGSMIGCHGYAVSHDADSLGIGKSLGLVTDATCTLTGDLVQVQWYKSGDGADRAVKLGQQLGGSGSCLVGENWLVCGSDAAVSTAQQKVGGSIQKLG